MTPAEIRELAIERVAQSDWENVGYKQVYPIWESVPEDHKQVWRRGASQTVDALGDLLPTEAEERDHAYHMGDGTPIVDRHRRYVTDWSVANDA